MSKEGVRHTTTHVPRTVLCFDKTVILEIASKNMILALAFRALHAWGL